MRTREQPSQNRPERFIVLANPISANARRLYRQVERLKSDNVVPIHTVLTDKDPRRTQDKLVAAVEEGDWLGVGAGDGTLNLVLRTVHEPITPMAGGNANDAAHMLHTRRALRQPRRILEQGRVAELFTLTCTVTLPDGEAEQHIAGSYLAFGATARASLEMNRDRRWRRIPGYKSLYVGTQALKGLIQSDIYKVSNGTAAVQPCYEHLLLNGKRMGKMSIWQADLLTPGAQEVVLAEKRLGTVANAIGRSTLGHYVGEEFTADDSRTFILNTETYMQADGEPTLLQPGTNISIAIAEQPHLVVTTLPEAV